MIRCICLNRSFFFFEHTRISYINFERIAESEKKGKETKNKCNDVQMLDNDGEESSGIQLENRSTIDIVVAANFFVPRLNLVP